MSLYVPLRGEIFVINFTEKQISFPQLQKLNLYSMKNYLFILAFVVLVACAGEKKAETTVLQPTAEKITIQKKKKIIYLSAKKELLTEGEALLEVAYPQFKNAGNEQATATLNSLIKTLIDTTISRFKNQSNGIDANTVEKTDTIIIDKKDVATYKDNAGVASRSLFIAYEINYQAPDYVELEFGINEFVGGAHGLPYTVMLHYDVANGKGLTFKDLFVENANYLEQISKLSTENLTARMEEIGTSPEAISTGTAPEEINFKNFSVKNDSLLLFFDPYAVASYAAGPQIVKIHLSKLESILNKNSVLVRK
jgi:uncharacterized protein YcfL